MMTDDPQGKAEAPADDGHARALRLVKMAIAVLSVLLLLAMGGLVYGLLSQRGDGPADLAKSASPEMASPAASHDPGPAGYRVLPLDEPPGSRIEAAFAADGLVYLQIVGGGAPDRLLVLSGQDHRVVSRITVSQATGPANPGAILPPGVR